MVDDLEALHEQLGQALANIEAVQLGALGPPVTVWLGTEETA